MDRKELYKIFRLSLMNWLNDNAILRAAALTFFIILPLPTLLFIVTAIFELFYTQTQAIQILNNLISTIVGPSVAGLFNQLLSNTTSPFTSFWTAIVVVGFSIFGLIGAFSVLRDTMDCIWEVRLPKRRPLWKRIRQKIGPFVLVSALGLIVAAWTAIASSLFSLVSLYSINGTLTVVSIAISQVVLSFIVVSLLLAVIYKLIPEARVHWQDVTIASIVAGIAFTMTDYIFGTYIQTFTVFTVIGAAGALLVILLWIFILNQILLFGAEISKVYATTVRGHSKQPMPSSLERIIQPIEEVGKKIERAAKDEFETDENLQQESGTENN
jgi:membrane protein